MKLIVVGHMRHGKDTVCEVLTRDYGLTFASSSMRACEIFLYEVLRKKYGYTSMDECFEDRVNHRSEWFDLIVAYNKEDKSKLGRGIFETSDIYCGLRNAHELKALKESGVVDHVIWVDASKRLPPEPKSSMTITEEDCDYSLNNNLSLAVLRGAILQLMSLIGD